MVICFSHASDSFVYSPWCFIGKRRLEKAMKEVSDTIEFKVFRTDFKVSHII